MLFFLSKCIKNNFKSDDRFMSYVLIFEASNFKTVPFIQVLRYKDVLWSESSFEYANIFNQPASR